MSLKMIELQVAIPRTHEASKLQEQIQHREHAVQAHASDMVKKDVELKRSTVIKQEQKGNAKLDQHGQRNDGSENQHSKKKHQESNHENAADEKHPYKGAFIDYSG